MTTLVGGPRARGRRRLLLRSTPLTVALSFGFIGILLFLAAFGPLLAPHGPGSLNLATGLTTPNGEFWFGTDDLGRDVFSRTIYGVRYALFGPVLIVVGAFVIGNVLGLAAGYRGGMLDASVMRWVDLMYAVPGLLVTIVLIGVLGASYLLAVVVLVVLTSPFDTRVIRGVTLEQRSLPYVEAARTLGLPVRAILFRHIFPNILPISFANAFLNFAFSLVALSALSFLGLGIGPGTADWGRMLSESRLLLFENPAAALAPGGMIVLTATSMNLIGDWLYDRLADRGRAR
ncbi:MAG: ABC transporter permease [Nocardioidaceae bacterium]|nr:ABC transporter permease [Nocardioidaceae bacterium]MDQ3166235.1 ABC transporter permease [Actinomycetota bacterium]